MIRSRVLVDLLFFTGRKGGMESYVREVYSRFSDSDPDFEFVALASKELVEMGAPWFPGEVVDSGVSGENRLDWARGELVTVARQARRRAADLVHCPANFGPWRSAVPVVLTVQDLLAFRHPEYVPGVHATVVRGMIRLAARNARRILTISLATRLDLLELLGVPEGRIEVIPLASTAHVPGGDIPRQESRLLAVGNRMPHKGFETLLAAMASIDPIHRPRLVITGSHGDDPLRPVVDRLGLQDDVDLLGWIDADALDRLYRESTALVFPTRFEGFGLPPLEAMARGCPVIASDIPVLHEVAGDAARYVDPTDADAIAAAIRDVLDSPSLRAAMSAAGTRRAAEFSWDRTAEATRASFGTALGRSVTRA